MSERSENIKLALITVFLFCLVLAASYTVSMRLPLKENFAKGFDKDYTKSIFIEEKWRDQELLFSQEEQDEFTEAIREASEDLNMNIAVYCGHIRRDKVETQRFADYEYDKRFGKDTDGVFLYLDFSNVFYSSSYLSYDYISTSGKAILYYKSYIEDIFKGMNMPKSYDLHIDGFEAHREGVKNAIYSFLREIKSLGKNENTLMSGLSYFYSKDTKKYVYYFKDSLYITDSRPPYYRFIILAVSELLGLLVAFCFWLKINKDYSSVSSPSPSIYIDRNCIKFNKKKDEFLRKTERRVKQGSSSSSHSGGSRSQSSGGTHGGGGYHR